MSDQMAASIPSGMFFDTCCKAYAGIRAEHAQLTDVKLLLDAAKKTGEAYDFIFSPGGMVSNTLVGDLKMHMQSVEKCFASFNGSHKYLEDMCKAEVDGKTLAKVRANRGSGLVATVWLLRHLLFVTRFIRYLLEMDPATPSECAKKTYDEVLKPYHGFMLGGIVGAAMGLAPTREQLYKNLGIPEAETVRPEMRRFLDTTLPIVDGIKAWLDASDWYFPDKA